MSTVSEPEVESEDKRDSGRLTFWLIVVVVVLVPFLGYMIWQGLGERPLLSQTNSSATVIQSEQPVENFSLIGAGNQPVALEDFRGKVVLLYFGYTFCPDVCPTTMGELKRAMEGLGDEAENMQVIMVSVDPLRDTPEVLAQYITHFDPSFIGLTGTEEELIQITKQLGIFYEKHEGSAASGYLVDHTASVLVLDKQGYLRLIFPYGMTGKEMVGDLKFLSRE